MFVQSSSQYLSILLFSYNFNIKYCGGDGRENGNRYDAMLSLSCSRRMEKNRDKYGRVCKKSIKLKDVLKCHVAGILSNKRDHGAN